MCLAGMAVGAQADIRGGELADLFQSTLLASLNRFGSWADEGRAAALRARFIEIAPTVGPQATAAACEASRSLGAKLGLRANSIAALDHVHECWDGRGLPGTCAGEDLPLIAGSHHERLDGTGYHRCVAGAALSRESRLLAAADVLHALGEARPHRPAHDLDSAAVSHGPQAPPAEGPDGVSDRIAVYQDALDGYWDIQEIHSAGDTVVVRWIGRGTHTGELMGVPPTGAAIAVDAITILRISGGKIAEEWTVWDALGLLQQVGAVPIPA